MRNFVFLGSAIMTLTIISFCASTDSFAQSRRSSVNAGICPAGTCSRAGTQRAVNVKNCKAEYCHANSQTRRN